MGGGFYDTNSRTTRATALGYTTKSREELFVQRKCHDDLNPAKIKIREARDSADHPESYPIIIGLDVTGSMAGIPHRLLQTGLPHIMESILQMGVKDPALLIMAIGDYEYDRAPLQVSQFESSDELLDKWLTRLFLEQGGGGNDHESYFLPWVFTRKIVTDAWEKRKFKGTLITIGDEALHPTILGNYVNNLMPGLEFPSEMNTKKLLEEVSQKWNVHHINCTDGARGRATITKNSWQDALGPNCVHKTEDFLMITIAEMISIDFLKHKTSKAEYTQPDIVRDDVELTQANKPEEML